EKRSLNTLPDESPPFCERCELLSCFGKTIFEYTWVSGVALFNRVVNCFHVLEKRSLNTL
ncbi:MAG: hypothetical protein MUC81_10810, partial [Bacteroidia bacterium]|nr:hypothetical protein [Bacteroidia bacterium]